MPDSNTNENESETGGVGFEEIIEDPTPNQDENTMTRRTNANETTLSGSGTRMASTSAQFREQVSAIEINNDVVENIMGKSPDLTEMMNQVKPTARCSVETIAEVQGKLFEAKTESISEILSSCPKEFFLVGFPCLTILIWKSSETLFYILICILICYSIHKFLSHRETVTRDNLKNNLVNAQNQAILQEGKSNQEIGLAMGNIVKDMQENRTNATVQISNINKDVVTAKLEALRQMQLAELEGNLQIAKIKEDGSTNREELLREAEKNVATIKADIEKVKAEVDKETQIEIAKLENQKVEVIQQTAVKIKKIETELETNLETLKKELELGKVQFQKDEEVAKRVHEAKLEEDKLKFEAEARKREADCKKDVELKKIEAEMEAGRQRTEQIKIQEKGKCDRDHWYRAGT